MAKISLRKFSFAYLELYYVCMQKARFMERDADEFAEFGVDAELINTFKSDANEFAEAGYDSEYSLKQKHTTAAKSALQETLYRSLRRLQLAAKKNLKKSDTNYAVFATKGLVKLNAKELIKVAKEMEAVASAIVASLQPYITAVFLESIVENCAQLEIAIEAQEDAVAERDVERQKRTDAANELYDQLSLFCQFGKTIWRTNYAKQNDYRIAPNAKSNATSDVPPDEDVGGTESEDAAVAV